MSSLETRAGNRVSIALAERVDPVLRTLRDYNARVVLSGPRPATSEEPLTDGKAYPMSDAPQPFCRPYVKIGYRTTWNAGPEVCFVRRADGIHLTAAFVEDPAQRVAGAAPFDVRVSSVKLVYGAGPGDVVTFSEPTQAPLSDPAGPAFRVEVDALLPGDERLPRIVAALQAPAAARWSIEMQFEWVQATPDVVVPRWTEPRPRIRFPFGRVRAVVDRPFPFERAEPAEPPEPPEPPPPEPVAPPPAPPAAPHTIVVVRELAAEYPPSAAVNKAIYAAVGGDYTSGGWQASAHGWYAPAPVPGTVYCLPDAYRLAVDRQTGLPSIRVVVYRKPGAVGDDVAALMVRLVMRVTPDFDPVRLERLRTLVRTQSGGQLEYADLVLGGYSGASFKQDSSIAGLGELFGGATAPDAATIDPADGFTVTYQGSLELLSALSDLLQSTDDPLWGAVLVVVKQPDGTTQTLPVGVHLSLARMAPVALGCVEVDPYAPPSATYTVQPGDAPYKIADHCGVLATHPAWWKELKQANPQKAVTADGGNWKILGVGEVLQLPTSWLPPPLPPPPPTDGPTPTASQVFRVTNPTGAKLQISGVEASALRKSPFTQEVDQAFDATAPSGLFPLALKAHATRDFALELASPQIVNAWDIAFLGARPVIDGGAVLNQLFDVTAAGIEGWKVSVECPPLEFFDRLSAEEQAALDGVIAIEVAVRRSTTSTPASVKLTRASPRAEVMLSRTVSDYLGDRGAAASTFQHRRRFLRASRADEWTEWANSQFGESLLVYLS